MIFDTNRQVPDWNARFIIEKLPDYSAFNDKNCKNYFRFETKNKDFILTRTGQKVKLRHEHPNRIQIQKNKPFKFSEQNKTVLKYTDDDYISRNMDQIYTNQIKISQQQLANIWELRQVPLHHRENIIQCLQKLNKKDILDFLNKEIKCTENNRNIVIKIEKTIQARENCLQIIKVLVEDLALMNQKNDIIEDIEKYIEKFQGKIQDLRVITVSIIQMIVKWRRMFVLLMGKSKQIQEQQYKYQMNKGLLFLPYVYKQKNYLLKIFKDLNFICQHKFVKNLFQLEMNDPFQLNSNQYKEPDYMILQKIEACDIVLKKEKEYYSEKSQKQQLKKYCKQFQGISQKSNDNVVEMDSRQSQQIEDQLKVTNIQGIVTTQNQLLQYFQKYIQQFQKYDLLENISYQSTFIDQNVIESILERQKNVNAFKIQIDNQDNGLIICYKKIKVFSDSSQGSQQEKHVIVIKHFSILNEEFIQPALLKFQQYMISKDPECDLGILFNLDDQQLSQRLKQILKDLEFNFVQNDNDVAVYEYVNDDKKEVTPQIRIIYVQQNNIIQNEQEVKQEFRNDQRKFQAEIMALKILSNVNKSYLQQNVNTLDEKYQKAAKESLCDYLHLSFENLSQNIDKSQALQSLKDSYGKDIKNDIQINFNDQDKVQMYSYLNFFPLQNAFKRTINNSPHLLFNYENDQTIQKVVLKTSSGLLTYYMIEQLGKNESFLFIQLSEDDKQNWREVAELVQNQHKNESDINNVYDLAIPTFNFSFILNNSLTGQLGQDFFNDGSVNNVFKAEIELDYKQNMGYEVEIKVNDQQEMIRKPFVVQVVDQKLELHYNLPLFQFIIE